MRIIFVLFFISNITFLYSNDTVLISIPVEHNLNMMIAQEIISEVYKNAGIDCKFVTYSLEKSMALITKGDIDAELIRAKQIILNNPEVLIIDVPVLNIETVAFYKNETISIESWDDLKNYNVSYEKGIKVTENNLVNCNKLFPANSIKDAFTLLSKGRVDIVITGKVNGLYNAGLLQIDGLYYSESLSSIALYHLVNKKLINIVPLLEEQLLFIDRESYYTKIINREINK
ncbi:MAG: transporter substrate-binding domain-containing protein [Spirochaetales bacterium]|nr:transporter substrate-binding domain-containing protein [Spirochaetales bacterium]